MRSLKWLQTQWYYVRFRRLGGGICAGQTPVTASQSKAPEDLAGVRAAAERFLRALDDLDWEPFRTSWASEPTVFFPFGDTPDRVIGRTAVEARWRRFFEEARARATRAALPEPEAARHPDGALRGCGTGHIYA